MAKRICFYSFETMYRTRATDIWSSNLVAGAGIEPALSAYETVLEPPPV
jgi:hypothetical protein